MSAPRHTGPPHNGGTYLLTEDLRERITKLGINTPSYSDPLYGDLQDRLARALEKALWLDAAVYRKPMSDIATDVFACINDNWGDENILVVSTCPELSFTTLEDSASISVNRTVSLENHGLGVGPRPGEPPLTQQINSVIT